MCCTTAKWKREEVPDHKFDYIDVNDFFNGSIIRRFTYLLLFAVIIKNILVYLADLWTVYLLFTSQEWAANIQSLKSHLDIIKWIFFASIVSSFLLLLWELRKAVRVVKSHDIAYSYTCTGAYRFYSVRSYPHYCLFSQINNSRKKIDRVAFFVYFTLKGWKRFLLAEAPRQVVNGISLFSVYIGKKGFDIKKFYENGETAQARIMFGLMTFTFCVWAISALLLAFAAILYVPLLCQIRGNLKEYVCHKIDKRLAQLLRNKSRKRILEERREQQRLAQEMQSLPGANTGALLPSREPTLPQVQLLESSTRQPMPPTSQNAVMILPDNRPPPLPHSNAPISYQQQQQQQQQQHHHRPSYSISNSQYSAGNQYSNEATSQYSGRRRADSTVSSTSGYSQSRPIQGADGINYGGARPPMPPIPPHHVNSRQQPIPPPSQRPTHLYNGNNHNEGDHIPQGYRYEKELSSPLSDNTYDIPDNVSESSHRYANQPMDDTGNRPLPRPPQSSSSNYSKSQPVPPQSSSSAHSNKSPTQPSAGAANPNRYPYQNIYDHPPRNEAEEPSSMAQPLQGHIRHFSNEGHRYASSATASSVQNTSHYPPMNRPTEIRHQMANHPAEHNFVREDNSVMGDMDGGEEEDNDDEPTINRYNNRGRYAGRHNYQQQQQQQQQQQRPPQSQGSQHSNMRYPPQGGPSSQAPHQLRRPGNSQNSHQGGNVYF